MTLRQVIQNGPNAFTRVLGQATLEGETVNLRVAMRGMFHHARIEYREAVETARDWHVLGGNFSLEMPFSHFLRAIPCVANVVLMSDVEQETESDMERARR